MEKCSITPWHHDFFTGIFYVGYDPAMLCLYAITRMSSDAAIHNTVNMPNNRFFHRRAIRATAHAQFVDVCKHRFIHCCLYIIILKMTSHVGHNSLHQPRMKD